MNTTLQAFVCKLQRDTIIYKQNFLSLNSFSLEKKNKHTKKK